MLVKKNEKNHFTSLKFTKNNSSTSDHKQNNINVKNVNTYMQQHKQAKIMLIWTAISQSVSFHVQ